MNPRLWCVILIALSTLGALAQFGETVRPDTLRSDSVAAWPDTSVAAADTLVPPPHASWRVTWLCPLGLAIVSGVGFILLYSTRSR